ncbi:MAG TPA: glutamate 5-kinase [Bacteroidales bacterium]|nr:glutamate 5-kinase [Bacteroidales bacterium]HQJ20987.1 glutamate 5-kinase [Bacteroidales bacterium]
MSFDLKNRKSEFSRITVKIGSNVVTQDDGTLNNWRISRIVEDVAILFRNGIEVIIVTSGAVAAGRGELIPSKKTNEIAAKQVLAAIGQVKLMAIYQYLFGKYGIKVGQVLATKESFSDRRHYLNMKNCISAMLENHVIPVVNENDTISINELMFTDNDELSGMISSMMDCKSLIILSNVDGIFKGVPGQPGSELIKEVLPNSDDVAKYISGDRSETGRGGMITKYLNARKIASEGISVFIANGLRDSILTDIIRGKDVPCTKFVPAEKHKKSIKKWIAHSETFTRGEIIINSGARDALLGNKASSLLLIGVTGISGLFKKGDIVKILSEDGEVIGLGKSEYDSEKAKMFIGQKCNKPLIHYNYLVINQKEGAESAV